MYLIVFTKFVRILRYNKNVKVRRRGDSVYVLYMDILFLINFVMDSIIFWITTMLLNQTVYLRKILIGGGLAALIYCMLFSNPILQRLPYSISGLIVPVIPILYLYQPTHLKKFIKYYIISMGVAALIGGLSFTLWYQFQYYIPNYKLTLSYIIVISLSVGIIIYLSFYAIRKRFVMPHFEYDLEIHYDGKVECIPALLDTGNMLYTPMGHKPVLVVTYDVMKNILNAEECKRIESCRNDIEKMLVIDEGPKYIIPFHSMGCEKGLLWGVMSECIILHKGVFKKQIPKCVIGIAFDKLSNSRMYKALIHPDFIVNEGE